MVRKENDEKVRKNGNFGQKEMEINAPKTQDQEKYRPEK